MEGILKKIINAAKSDMKKIVLPETTDQRVLNAANKICKEKIADIILVGKAEEITRKCYELGINLDSNIQIVDPCKDVEKEIYTNTLCELRKKKGMTSEEAKKLILEPIYFAMMMLYFGRVDGVVSGAIHSTADTLRPALQIIPKKENVDSVSSFFLMETKNTNLGSNGAFIFSDCALIEEPTESQLEDISNASVENFKRLVGDTPKVAFLSYSSFGSAKDEKIDKIRRTVKSLKNKSVSYDLDGEMQLDTAIIKEVAKLKAPQSSVAGNANILIFPNLEAGNIGYKLAQRFGNMIALGPITQGFAKPVNDLSRGCNIDDIIGVVAITCVQAQNDI